MSNNTRREISIFPVLSCFFIICLLISNIIAGKLIQIASFTLPAAVILFPITYLLGDILTEVYGFERARQVIWMGFAANIFMVVIFTITIALPSPGFFENKDAYNVVLGFTPRLAAASLAAYWAGEFLTHWYCPG